MSEGIRFNDRVLVVGYTRSGKSELLNHLFTAMRTQRVLVDTKDEWAVPGVEPVSDPGAIDWRQPVIHFTADLGDRSEFERLFAVARRRARPLTMCVHELADLCDYEPHRTPPSVKAYLSKGAAHGLGLLGASQRPFEMPRRARTEAQHVFCVVPRIDPDDLRVVAQSINREPAELAELLDRMQHQHGQHSFLWFDRRRQVLTPCPPLPAHLRRRTIVRRRTLD